MRLLKTVLLSTTLLMSVVSAADFPGSEEPATAAHMEFQLIIEKSQTFEKTVLAGLLEIIELYNPTMHGVVMGRAGAEGLSIQDAFPALIEMIGIMESKAEAADSEVTVKAELNETLSKEKAAQEAELDAVRRELAEVREAKTQAESALASTREELEAVAAAKAQVEGQLEEANVNVNRLRESINAIELEANSAGESKGKVIEGLQAELREAKAARDELAAKVKELTAWKDASEKKIQQEAETLRLLNLGGAPRAAVEEGTAVARGQIFGFDSDDEGGVDGSPESMRSFHLGGSPASPAANSGAGRDVVHTGAGDTVAPASVTAETAAKIAELQSKLAAAQEGTTASPFSGKRSESKNREAQAAAQKEVSRLTAELAKLGVDATAAKGV